MMNLRPGVYSSYTTAWGYNRGTSPRHAGLVCLGNPSFGGVLYTITSLPQAEEIFGGYGEHQYLIAYIKLLLRQGVSAVVVSVVQGTYQGAAQLLGEQENIGVVFSDSANLSDCKDILHSVVDASDKQKERICFFGRATVEEGVALATSLNHSRCVVVAGKTALEDLQHPLFGACSLGGALLAINDPGYNLNGIELEHVTLHSEFSEEDIQQLLQGGATPLETIGGTVECVRGVTTHTTQNGQIDTSYRSINTVLLVDDVLISLRESLQRQLKGLRTLDKSLGSIGTQVSLLLEEKVEFGRITSYQPPKVSLSPQDPTLCIVEVAFTVAHVISQIYLSAQVQL